MKALRKLLEELRGRPRWVTSGMGQRKHKTDGPDFLTMIAALAYCKDKGHRVTVRVDGRVHKLYPRGQVLCCESDPPHYYDGAVCDCWGAER